MFKRIAPLALVGSLVTRGAYAASGEVDYSQLLAAVDFSDVIAGVLAVGAVIMAVLVVVRGVQWIMDQIGGYDDDYGPDEHDISDARHDYERRQGGG